VLEAQRLLASLSGGRAVLFYALVLLHAVCALVGFGSIGFAGTYASRAYLPEDGPGRSQHGPGSSEQGPASSEQGPVSSEQGPVRSEGGPVSSEQGPASSEHSRPAGTEVADEDAETEELLRYFEKPARLWLALVAVPFLGLGALASDPDLGGVDQAWVLGALLVWLSATLIAASLVVPALRQMRSMLFRPVRPADQAGRDAERIRFARAATLVGRGAACCDVLFFVALALMTWRP
jgi:hypothetical protein